MSLFDPPSRKYTKRKGLVSKQHNRAFLFFDDESTTEIWIPHKLVKDFQCDCAFKLADPSELMYNDEVEITVPKWLLRKEGIAA